MAHAGPLPDSYWASPLLLAGPLPTGADRSAQRAAVRALLDAGIRAVLDLRTPSEPPSIRALLEKLARSDEDVTWMGVPILDGAAPSVASMRAILDAIDASVAHGQAIYLHCQGGRGRTGTVVACWWIRHGLFDPETALAELGARRLGQPNGARPSPETGPQLRLVRAWSRGT